MQQSDTSSSNSVKNSHIVNTVQGATEIASAAGENIAVDGSKITTAKSSSINLSGAAQQNASAINLVNAAGSMVANGVNIARTANMNATPTLNQMNSISQIR